MKNTSFLIRSVTVENANDNPQVVETKSKFKIELKSETKAIWLKGLYILFFIVASYIMIFITFFVVVFQFIGELIFKKPNEHLQNFGETLGLYSSALVRFITGATDEMPFPFKKWPKQGSAPESRNH